MNPSRGLGRREFLRGLCAAGVAGLAPLSWSCHRGVAPKAALAGFFDDRRSAAIVGRVYLNAQPEAVDADELVASIVDDSDRAHRDWNALWRDPDAMREALRERHREDLARGDVVDVDGWLLSLTEARLCALAEIG